MGILLAVAISLALLFYGPLFIGGRRIVKNPTSQKLGRKLPYLLAILLCLPMVRVVIKSFGPSTGYGWDGLGDMLVGIIALCAANLLFWALEIWRKDP
ncbi:MAG: hypothetical protein JKX69_15305 [Rhodobacteraceae bacterium]|nr:hypothetical protein [Paracoccaceae bacterium]